MSVVTTLKWIDYRQTDRELMKELILSLGGVMSKDDTKNSITDSYER